MGNEMPKYDLIIIDEVESNLNQFNSRETFKGNQRDTYNYLDAVLKNSILAMGCRRVLYQVDRMIMRLLEDICLRRWDKLTLI